MTDIIDINKLKKTLAAFAKEREWEKFHDPKNLSMAVANEAGELLEIFQWLTPLEAVNVKTDVDTKKHVGEELADIMLYVIRLADRLDINLNEALHQKIELNHAKYPAKLVKGSAKKSKLIT